jgi:hypothetical protein
MNNETHKPSFFHNVIKLMNVTTAEMYAIPNVAIGFVVFNTDIQKTAVYTNNSWVDCSGNPILNILFSEDFETGDFSNWNVVNDDENKWIVGQAEKYSGTNGAYISNDNIYARYTQNRTQISHFWKEFTFPVSTQIQMEIMWKCLGEINYDYGRVYAFPDSEEPVAHEFPLGSYLISSNLNNSVSWQKEIIDLTAFSGQTKRIVNTWRNDGSQGNNPAICLDNIKIIYK